jgi:hypothetical protein
MAGCVAVAMIADAGVSVVDLDEAVAALDVEAGSDPRR